MQRHSLLSTVIIKCSLPLMLFSSMKLNLMHERVPKFTLNENGIQVETYQRWFLTTIAKDRYSFYRSKYGGSLVAVTL